MPKVNKSACEKEQDDKLKVFQQGNHDGSSLLRRPGRQVDEHVSAGKVVSPGGENLLK